MSDQPVTMDIEPIATEVADTMRRIGEAMDIVREVLAQFIEEVCRVMGPTLGRMVWLVKMRDHRRRQDERRCYAKAGRRERSGWGKEQTGKPAAPRITVRPDKFAGLSGEGGAA